MDLNLLRVFTVIYTEGNLTLAAQKLNLTQPTLSHALSRLRRHFNDELFVRKGRGLIPTARADELFEKSREGISRLELAWYLNEEFEPSESNRTFRLALTDLGEMDFLPNIIAELQRLAPAARLEVVPLDITTIELDLKRGQLDAAITSTGLEGLFESALLKSERYAVVGGSAEYGSLLQDVESLLSGISRLPLVLVRPQIGHQAPVTAIERAGFRLNHALTVQTFSAVPRILSVTSMCSIVPETIAQGWVDRWGLALCPLPDLIPTANVRLYWPAELVSAGVTLDAGRLWLIELIRSAVK